PAPGGGEVAEELDAAIDVLDDDVLEVRAEEAGQRRREVCGRLDAVGEQAGEGRVLRLDERLRASADALAARVHLRERVEARPLLARLRLRLFERLLALGDLAAEDGEALLHRRLLLGARHLSRAQILDRARELLGPRAELEEVALPLLTLGRELLLAGVHLVLPADEALELRLGPGDRLLRLAHELAEL